MRQMKVDKLGIDLLTHDPVVILKASKTALPADPDPGRSSNPRSLALEGTAVRPLSRDLMRALLEVALGLEAHEQIDHDIKDLTFAAKSSSIVRAVRVQKAIVRAPPTACALARCG